MGNLIGLKSRFLLFSATSAYSPRLQWFKDFLPPGLCSNCGHIDLDSLFLKNYLRRYSCALSTNFLMELLLNLAWLLLALPAFWLWRASRGAAAGRRLTTLQCLLSLGCVLVVLFPVISATDDLRAMRAEMEESPSTKRHVCQKSAEKASPGKWQGQPSLASCSNCFVPTEDAWHFVVRTGFSLPSAPAVARTGRSPPQSSLA